MIFEAVGNQVEEIDGILSYNEIFICLDVMIIIHFFMTWFFSYKKTGWIIDNWHFTLLMSIVISNFIQYPFITSSLNLMSLGNNWVYVQETAEAVLFINVIGYICIYIGRWIYDNIYPQKYRVNAFEKIVYQNIRDNKILRCLGVFCLLLTVAFVILQIQMGIFGNPRAFFLAESSYRPLFNGLSSLIAVLMAYFIIKMLDESKKIDIIICASLMISSLFMGARALFIGALMNLVTFYVYKRKGKVSIGKILFYVCIGVVLLIVVTIFRGDADLQGLSLSSLLLVMFFYGNSFSDLRDGALFFSYNSDVILYGKTYLAGLMSFMPRFLSEFREQWAIGVITAGAIGFDSTTHPGLRISFFGEVFLNFWYVGVIVLGLIYGFFLRKYDCLLRKLMSEKKPIACFFATSYLVSSFLGLFFNSANFSGVYVFIGVNIIIYLMRKINDYILRGSK